MASSPPFILADNIFDRINLYPLADPLSSPTPIAGREPNYVADYRRERTYFQIAAAAINQYIFVNLGLGNGVAPDTVWLDRGHNLWGKTLYLNGDDPAVGGSSATVWLYQLPAAGTVGGDPTNGWAVTEEGAAYSFINPILVTTKERWILYCQDNWAPLYTGIIIGKRTQLLNYSSVLDEDEGERDERQENSLIKGYYGRERVYAGRKLRVQLATIGVTEYDTNIRSLRRLLFEKDQPAFIVMNYSRWPERGWLYQYQGTGFSAPAERVYRRASFTMQELGPLIR